MHTHTEKTPEKNKSHSVANEVFQKQGNSESVFQFVDNRPGATVQRKFQDEADNSPGSANLKAFQDMADNYSARQQQLIQKKENKGIYPMNAISSANKNSVLQLGGPREYSKKFKKKKDEMVKWVKESELIGFDLSDESEETSLEENQKFGWHHLYPYSELYDNNRSLKLHDHGANLKLGPMRNRLGDPGDEVDISYAKAEKLPGATSRDQIKPTYSPFAKKLMEANGRSGSGESPAVSNVGIEKVDGTEFEDEVLKESTKKEEYWSEWYLSENLRKELLGKSQVETTITSLKNETITSKKADIVKTLNDKLDSLRHSYATHTPADEKGKPKAFELKATVETGIPSSKLNRKGVLGKRLVEDSTKTYADLVHELLVGEKWVVRGSQGEAHSLKEQFKEKMRTGNADLIKKILKQSSLNHLKTVVEEEFKEVVFNSIPEFVNKEEKKDLFFERVKAAQQKNETKKITDEELETIIKERLYNEDRKLIKMVVTQQEGEFVEPESFEPEYPEDDIKELVTLYNKFYSDTRRNPWKEDSADPIAQNIINDNVINTQEDDLQDTDKHWIYASDHTFVLKAEDLEKCFNQILKGKKVGGEELDLSRTIDFAKVIIEKMKEILNEESYYIYEPEEGEEIEVAEEWTLENTRMFIQKKLYPGGKDYMRHKKVLENEEHDKYCESIEAALSKPGQGYTDASLKYPLPKEIEEADAGRSWDFDPAKEDEFKQKWYSDEFEEFLKNFIERDEIQASLLHNPPQV